MNFITRLLLTGTVAALLGSGCAINNIQQVEQPATAAPGSQIDIYVLGTYYVMNQDSVFSTPWVRDKMLISAFLPDGWMVNSVMCHIDTNAYRTMQRYMSGDTVNTGSLDLAHIIDSLSALAAAPGQTMDYESELRSMYDVGTNRDVSSFILTDAVNLPAGTKADTVVEDTSGMVDSLYMKLVAYYIHLNVTTSSTEDTLFTGFFTSFMPDSMGSGSYDMENAVSDSNRIIITSSSSIRTAGRKGAAFDLTLSRHPLSGSDRITIDVPLELAGSSAHVTLFSPGGMPYGSTEIKAAMGRNSFSIADVTDPAGLAAGTYILRIRMGGSEYQRQIIVK